MNKIFNNEHEQELLNFIEEVSKNNTTIEPIETRDQFNCDEEYFYSIGSF